MASNERHEPRGPSTRLDHESGEFQSESDEAPSRPDWLRRDQTIGRYRIRECLGVGGMGVIYSAWDPQLDRELAIKVVRGRDGHLASSRSRKRLLREGQALARLRHPNVIAVHDVGTHEDRVFVAMEFVEGQTLHRWLLRSPRPATKQLVDVFLKVGRGLAAAHRAGLVHRDVKPENVMIGQDGRVLVLDFGIAREGYGNKSDVIEPVEDPLAAAPTQAVEAEPTPPVSDELDEDRDEARPGLTRAGAIVGTPAYMSPEQHRGLPVDPRSDQFSYCVAMWEALNGEKPYGEGAREKLLARMRLGQLKPFRNREVHRRVSAALQRGLAWNPGERHPSMEALLETLNPRGLEAERRLWLGLGLGAVGGMLLGVLTTISSVGLRPSVEPGDRSCLRARAELSADWNADRALALGRGFQATGLARADASWFRTKERLDAWASRWTVTREQACAAHFVERHDSASLHDRKVRCLERQRQRFVDLLALLAEPDAARIDGAVTAAIALPEPSSCASLTLEDDATTAERPTSAMTTRHRRELRTKLAELELALAHEPRLASLERARQLSAAARELADPSLLADVLLVHAELLARSGESRDAAEVLHEALTTAATANDLHTEARAALALADQIEDLDDARRWLELGAALASAPASTPASAPHSTLEERRSLDTRVHLGRAALARREGQLERARAELGAARETLESDGDPSQLLPEVLRALAEVSAELGDRDGAVALLRRALVLSETAHGPNHPRVAELRRELAGALAELGELDAALGEFERSLASFEQTRGPGPDTVRVRSEIGALLARRGRCDEAWAPLAAAVADAHQTLAPGSLVHARALEAQALACDFGHPEASALARAAVEIRIQRQAQGHPELIASQAILTLARLTRGEIDAKDALSALDEATRSDAFSNDALAAPDEATRSDAFAAPHEQALLDAARGLILAELERSDEARALLERALTSLEPSSALIPRVKQGLERLEPQPAYNPRDDGRDRGR